MKPQLTIVTGNELKFKELQALLAPYFECEKGDVSIPEIQGTPEQILEHKLKSAWEMFKHPVLVDDTSFHIERLGGFPGPYMKDFTKAIGVEGIGEKFTGDHASIISWIGLMRSATETMIVSGACDGSIVLARTPVPEGSLSFDPIFVPDGQEKSFAEMTTEEKNSISHRGKALRALLEKLQ